MIWTPHELELLDALIERERDAGDRATRIPGADASKGQIRLALERIAVLVKARSLGLAKEPA